eukprot:GHVR01140708.1.p1 GENE.GHVR01140708.1~~GHVR01140708.1.p1  ORF type:complete len:147 (+),score=72.37 GHVR01140708.1:102-542(+)
MIESNQLTTPPSSLKKEIDTTAAELLSPVSPNTVATEFDNATHCLQSPSANETSDIVTSNLNDDDPTHDDTHTHTHTKHIHIQDTHTQQVTNQLKSDELPEEDSGQLDPSGRKNVKLTQQIDAVLDNEKDSIVSNTHTHTHRNKHT